MIRKWLLVVPAVVCLLVTGMALRVVTEQGRPVQGAEETDNEQLVYHGVTACGVERWWVKTGIDSGASRLNTHALVSTSIFHLRSLPAPGYLPSRSRIQPVETTDYRVSGYLLRIKMEADSDFHLVIADGGGRTMIVESPAPQCVGSNSPFLPQIRYVRRVLTSRFHPNGDWIRGHWLITVTGVGFFDFLHGQSGVAPNAIELHPVLNVKFSSGSPTPPGPPKKSPTPKPSGGSFTLSASVSPNPVSYGQYATLTARSISGASCTGSVVYSTGRPPASFNGYAQTVGSGGSVSWSWHMESKGSSGSASVDCTYRGSTKTATTGFTIG